MKLIQFALLLGASLLFASCDKPAQETTARAPAQIGEMCGGIAGIQCAEGAYCQSAAGLCNSADVSGICVVKRPFCTRDYVPVCGCDGKTYGNACEAAAAGVNVDRDGAC